MHYEKELRFFCDVLSKSKINVFFVSPDASLECILDEMFKALFSDRISKFPSIINILEKVEPYTIYKFTNPFKMCYIFLLLPNLTPSQVMVIGPYVSKAVETDSALKIGEKYGLSPQNQKLLTEYYSSLPLVSEHGQLFTLLEAFGEHIWGGASGFKFTDINRELLGDSNLMYQKNSGEDAKSLMANIEMMQIRYDFENELIRAVSLGQEHKAPQIMERLSETYFEQRTADPLRNMKNYCIIMNTLLRKAAENGGVHPVYINDISSDFATKIEKLPSTRLVGELMSDMFKGYCRLVRKYSMRNYSPTVRKVITLINSDLSAHLTLSSLAQSQNISAGYLSAIFKKDTGLTVTEYITRERMQLAVRLLSATSLQIQTVALHCGIMDVQYFSKLFKKHIGKTPKEFRRSSR